MEVKKDSWLKIIWRLFYPLFLYTGITVVLEVIVCVILVMQTMVTAGASTLASDQLMSVMNQALESYLSVAYYVTIVSAIVTIPFLYLFYHKDRKRRFALGTEISYQHATVMEYVLVGLVAVAACLGGNNLIMGSGLVEIDESYQQVSEILYSAPMWVQVIGTGIIVPLCEELIFRGLMYNRAKEYMPARMAMIVSAFGFGLYHGNMVQMIYALALGCLMVYVYEKYHSFAAPFLFHAVANLVSVVITETTLFDFLYTSQFMMLVSGGLGILIVIIGIRIMRDTIKLEPEDPVSKVEL